MRFCSFREINPTWSFFNTLNHRTVMLTTIRQHMFLLNKCKTLTFSRYKQDNIYQAERKFVHKRLLQLKSYIFTT